jgi:hypothetical protein
MFLKDYLSKLTETIKDYTPTGMILSSEITADFRSEKVGLLKGKIVFLDSSILFFREYLDLRYSLDKKTYAFHYQNQLGDLRFRYDNAIHQPALAFIDHKHFGHEIIAADVPELEDVLEEIMRTYFSDMSGEYD